MIKISRLSKTNVLQKFNLDIQPRIETENSFASIDNNNIPVFVELEKNNNLDEKTKEVFKPNENKTFNLLKALGQLNEKNKQIFSKFKKSNDFQDELFNLEQEAPIVKEENKLEAWIQRGERPILDKLASRQNFDERKNEARSHLDINSNLDHMSKFNLNTNKNEDINPRNNVEFKN